MKNSSYIPFQLFRWNMTWDPKNLLHLFPSGANWETSMWRNRWQVAPTYQVATSLATKKQQEKKLRQHLKQNNRRQKSTCQKSGNISHTIHIPCVPYGNSYQPKPRVKKTHPQGKQHETLLARKCPEKKIVLSFCHLIATLLVSISCGNRLVKDSDHAVANPSAQRAGLWSFFTLPLMTSINLGVSSEKLGGQTSSA